MPTVKSANRVLEVLEYFAERHAPATVGEICDALGYPQSSTSVLLKSLAELDYLTYSERGRSYRPTVRVLLLGAWIQDELFGENDLMSEMEGLRRSTGCTVMVGIRQSIWTRFILVLPGEKRTLQYRAGTLIPACRSAIGKMLLSSADAAVTKRVAIRWNAEAPILNDRVHIPAFQTELTAVRAQGWAECLDFPHVGLGAVAVPLPQLADHPNMSISLGATKGEVTWKRSELLEALNDVCERLRQAGANDL